MRALSRLPLAAVCGLALGIHASASTPDSNNAVPAPPPHTAPDKSEVEAADMQALLQRARDAVNAAKKPEDLDRVLFDLQKYQNSGAPFGMGSMVAPSNVQLLQQIFSAIEFTKGWQNYLSHLASGQVQQARSDLQMLSENNSGFIPRSKILALMAGPQSPAAAGNAPPPAPAVSDAQKIVDAINTLDDLQPALGKLNQMAANDPTARAYAEHLAPMVEVYLDLKNGLPTSVNLDFMGGVTGAGISVKVNSMVLKFVLQHYFDTYKGAPPSDEETPAAYSTRVKNDALAGQDWALLKKALSVHAWLFRNVALGSPLPSDSDGVAQMITGLNQAQAGQYSLAVQSFQNALAAGSVDIPAKFIGAQLDEIKRDHPSEYNDGIEEFLSPQQPQMTYPGMNPGMYMNPSRTGLPYSAHMHRPAFPQRNYSSPKLIFPGAATNTAPQSPTLTPAPVSIPPRLPASTNAAPAGQ